MMAPPLLAGILAVLVTGVVTASFGMIGVLTTSRASLRDQARWLMAIGMAVVCVACGAWHHVEHGNLIALLIVLSSASFPSRRRV